MEILLALVIGGAMGFGVKQSHTFGVAYDKGYDQALEDMKDEVTSKDEQRALEYLIWRGPI